jgi:hypothetical protein
MDEDHRKEEMGTTTITKSNEFTYKIAMKLKEDISNKMKGNRQTESIKPNKKMINGLHLHTMKNHKRKTIKLFRNINHLKAYRENNTIQHAILKKKTQFNIRCYGSVYANMLRTQKKLYRRDRQVIQATCKKHHDEEGRFRVCEIYIE